MAAQLGVDVRMGFENNIYKPTGGLASSNADQVKRLADQLEEEVNWAKGQALHLTLNCNY